MPQGENADAIRGAEVFEFSKVSQGANPSQSVAIYDFNDRLGAPLPTPPLLDIPLNPCLRPYLRASAGETRQEFPE
jgi:hypothetical protein